MASKRHLLGVLLSLSVTMAVVLEALALCSFTEVVERDGNVLTVSGSRVEGSPSSAREQVIGGICGAFLVLRGTVLELAPVAVCDAEETIHTVMSVEVIRSWKAEAAGTQRVRLREDIADSSRSRPSYAPFSIGDECLLFVDRDSIGEFIVSPVSLAIQGSAVLGSRGVAQQISKELAFALVDSCVAEGTTSSMVRLADLIVEGDVELSSEDWLGLERCACSVRLVNLTVHKGVLADDVFELTNLRGSRGWVSWPKFEVGQRVLLFLGDDSVATHKLIGGWLGQWCLSEGDTFHLGRGAAPWRIGTVPLDEAMRADLAPARTMSRRQLAAALRRG